MIVSIVLIVLGFIAMGFFLYGKLTNYSFKTTIIKAVASSLFVALEIYLFCYKGYPTLGIFLMIGAFFGLIGDIALGLKRAAPKKGKLFTALGFLSFAIGHIIYISGLFTVFYIPGHFFAVLVPVIVSLLSGYLVIFALEKIFKLHFEKLRIPAMAYVVTLTSLTAVSLSLSIIHSFTINTLIILIVGGVFFFASDVLLCITYFGNKQSNAESIIYTITYYIAQFLIASSLFFL